MTAQFLTLPGMTIHQPETTRLPAIRSVVPQYARTAVVCFLAAWLAYTLWENVQRVAGYYVPIPVGDYWRVPQFLKAYQTLQIAAFWKQHNEHRIIFPEIVFALDMLLAHGRMLWPIVCNVLCYTGAWALLCFTVANDRQIPFFNRCCAVLVSGVLVFLPGSALVLAEPFLLQWPLMQLGVVLAIFFLKKAADTERAPFLTLAIASAVVATYSSANALVFFPLLIALGFAVRLSKRFMAALIVSAVFFVGLYFVGYHFSDSNFRAVFLHPAYFLGFTATYLSMPFGNLFAPAFGVSLGLLNFALVIFLAVRTWRARLFGTPPAVALFGFYAFTLLTIAITAAGRMDPADPTFGSARVTRYLTVPFLNWAAIVLLCYWLAGRSRWRFMLAVTLTGFCTLFLLIGVYKLRSWQEASEAQFSNAQVAAMNLDTGLTDSELIARIFPSPEFLEVFLPPLKTQHLAIFSRRHEDWFGKSITQFGSVLNRTLAGQIVALHPVEHGLELVGWVNSIDFRDPFPRILLVNERGLVVGWGHRPGAGFPNDWLSPETPEHESWIAFANLAIASRSVSAYAVTRHGLVAIPGVRAVPALEGASRSDVDKALPGVTWRIDKGWTPNETPTSPRFGWKPAANTVYSSWQHHDENTGRIVAEFARPANGCVSVGILHGPSAGGLAAQFEDADTGTVLGELPFRDHDSLWSLWRVRPSVSVKRIRFVATDNGKDWGQWLAIAGPLSCW